MKNNSSVLWPPLLLLLGQAFFVALYLQQGPTLPFWDYAMYADLAQKGFEGGWDVFKDSFHYAYNLLYAVPSFLTFALFGPSRFVFILTNFAFYFVAYQLALAFVLRPLLGCTPQRCLFWSFGLCSFLPVLWYPLLLGYPDHAAAACLTLGLGLLLRPNRSVHRALLLGLLLGFAVVFRRHFAYAVLVLLIVAGGFDFWAQRKVRPLALFYGVCGSVALVVLFGLEPGYLQEMAQTDFVALYQSYEKTPKIFGLFLLSRLGLGLFLPVLAGYVLAFFTFPNKRSFLFVLIYCLAWALVWAFGPAQASEHYLLAAPPVFCLVGLAALFEKVSFRPLLVGLVLLLGANSAYALWFAPQFLLPNEPPVPSLVSAPRPPWIRDDLGALRMLASYVEQTTTPADRVVVVSSSFVLNQDLMRVVYERELHKPSVLDRFLFLSEIDGVQPPNFDVFAGGTVFLVPEEPQYHLDPKGQKVLGALYALLPPPSFMSSLFERDPVVFSLANGVKLSLWRRKKAWPSTTLHKALSLMRSYADMATPWIILTSNRNILRRPSDDESAAFSIFFSSNYKESSFFFDVPLSPSLYRIGFWLSASPPCSVPEIRVRIRNDIDEVVFEKTGRPLQNPGISFAPFDLRTRTDGPFFASLDFLSSEALSCSVALWQLRVEEMNPKGLPTPPLTD